MSLERRLRQIYREVPDVGCKGLCAAACGIIPLSPAEQRALGSEPVMAAPDAVCPHLREGRCSIYERRPLICRLYGAVDTPLLRCPFGCEPKLTEAAAEALLRRLMILQ